MNNNQNEDAYKNYKKEIEELQDYCLTLKQIEKNIELMYNNSNNNNQKATQQAYLIDIEDYNKFKEQIDFNTFINDIEGHKEQVVTNIVIQHSQNKKFII